VLAAAACIMLVSAAAVDGSSSSPKNTNVISSRIIGGDRHLRRRIESTSNQYQHRRGKKISKTEEELEADQKEKDEEIDMLEGM
jgi:hypothetical protein